MNIIIPCPPPSQAKVHRALLLGVLTDARHVFTVVRNLYATFLHVSFRLLVSNQGASPREPTGLFLCLICVKYYTNLAKWAQKNRHPP